ncbi:LuxE/PaaK family acyltransferase [Halalkalibacterium ligniniphilum]|uniref:LuxE/PaaK family acyltransferase n=1 Tax=Halalkalibacterium ligniniphilum TaxID=1134413 RepID=UPI000346D460|nr:AMP-binding protein [Halalkalibacterium ligniniphilum]
MLQAYQKLKLELLDFMNQPSSTDEAFNEMALKVFTFQYEHNQAFRKFCRKRRVSPRTIKHYSEIPPVPIDAFKLTTLSCHPIEETEAVFMTSGTTNADRRGKNYHRDLEIYDRSMKTHFKPYIMPDVEKLKMYVLFPTQEEMPNSSLAHYLHIAKETFGTKDSQYAFSSEGFKLDELIEELTKVEKQKEPVLLIGATFSFIHLVDECKQRGIQFKLPANSRVMDTGGAKGRSREMTPNAFKKEMAALFSIPREMCVNMYGMTELSSQFYDGNINDKHQKNPISETKRAPHWMKTMVIDIETMKEKPKGEQGILVHYDLANLNSVMAILTEDVGIAEGEGFHLLGRASGAEAKGCSLAVEQFLASTEMQKGESL